ncbi:ubiquitin [Oscillospiraceae bacterium PP1C4]
MATLEQVEKLRDRANVSYDEAKEALKASNDDLLEALIYLEKQGKVHTPEGGGYYSSEKGESQSTAQASGFEGKTNDRGESFSDVLKRFGRFCTNVIHKGNTNTFQVLKGNESKAVFPVTVLVLLLVFAFWISLPLIVIGLFFGFRYRFVGPELGTEAVNHAMDSAANAAESLKNSISEQSK